MPPNLKVNGQDLSTYQRLQPDDGYDVTDAEFQQPQFGGAPALAEGGVWVADTVRNKQWTVPVWVRTLASQSPQAANDDAKSINGALNAAAAGLQFTPEGGTSTFFDIEAGRLDLQWSHFHHRQGYVKGEVKLWTRPFGHTGTMRSILPSQMTAGIQGPGNLLMTGLKGDAPALGNLYVSPSTISSNPGFFMYGITTLPSFRPHIHAATDMGFFLTATRINQATAIASQFRRIYAPPAAGNNLAEFYLRPDMFAGRHRVFGLLSHQYTGVPSGGSGIVQIWLEERTKFKTQLIAFGASPVNDRRINNATTVCPASPTNLFGFADLGEITVPSQVPGAAPLPTSIFTLAANITFPLVAASPGITLQGVVLLPLDHSAAVIPTMAVSGGPMALRSWPRREVSAGVPLAPIAVDTWGPSAIALQPLQSVLRGDPVRLPEGATQARLIVWSGTASSGIGGAGAVTDPMLVQFDVLERFRFLQ